MRAPQSDERHWRFFYESVVDLNKTLKKHDLQVLLVTAEVLPTFRTLLSYHHIENIFSHQETGIRLTYERDKAVKKFCQENGINWLETPYAGVIRGIKKRNNWPKHWYASMSSAIIDPSLEKLKPLELSPELAEALDQNPIPQEISTKYEAFQPGGESKALVYLESFLTERVNNYNKHISKPDLSRRSCSRLSPYLAWGNLSMRQVYQASLEAKSKLQDKRNINAFMSRLRWHCHFIQKFEMMDRYETENINPGYNDIRQDWDDELYLKWEKGLTGYPLIDACIRCVRATGYLNFRMRSMLVSFLTHHLWLHWKRGADFLASQFLDFEPGIHYAQFQMQAGTTGYNTVRIYNPVKQSIEHDPEGHFIRKWLPRLKEVPTPMIHEPWKMTAFDQDLYQVRIGQDYPAPAVNITETYKAASRALWSKKKQKEVKTHARKILAKQDEADRPID